MKTISGMYKSVHVSIGYQEYSLSRKYIPIPYVVEMDADSGSLLYNMLTREIVWLSQEEAKAWRAGAEEEILKVHLIKHWFLVPADVDARSLCYMFRHSHKAKFGFGSRKMELCTILTTTECNARCPYCYEAGCEKRTMTEAVALDVAKYIATHCNPDHVHLKWFGGEPLCNASVIGTICQYLREHDINYNSSMVSNGFLMHRQSEDEIRNLWRLKRVQVTLDGTEGTYNAVKGFITKENAFEKVLSNIEMLLKLGIQVNIRLNLSKENYKDLVCLTGILKKRLSHYRDFFNVYSRPLFEDESFHLTDDERAKLYEEYLSLQECIRKSGIGSHLGIPKVRHFHCMADDGKSAVVLPGGELGLCEHHTDDGYIGTIYSDERNTGAMQGWQERAAEIPECASCFYYPACIRLKKCPGKTVCNREQRKEILYTAQATMRRIYERFLER